MLFRDIDTNKITFYVHNGTHKISYNGKPLYANLSECPVTKALRARFKIDDPREDAGSRGGADERRGQALEIEDPELLKTILKLEEKCVEYVAEHSAEVFKKKAGSPALSLADVKARFYSMVGKCGDDAKHHIKIKIKVTGPRQIPTVLNLLAKDGSVIKNGARIEDMERTGGMMGAVVNVWGIWVMGPGTQWGVHCQAEEIILQPGAPRSSLSRFATTVPLELSTKTREEEISSDAPEAPDAPEASETAEPEGEVAEDSSSKRQRTDDAPAEPAGQADERPATLDGA